MAAQPRLGRIINFSYSRFQKCLDVGMKLEGRKLKEEQEGSRSSRRGRSSSRRSRRSCRRSITVV